MMFRRLCILALVLSPAGVKAASKEIQELQRDVAQLQDMVRAMQRNQDEKFSALQVLVQQALNASTDAGKSAAVIQSGFQQSLRELENKVVTPVVGVGTRMDAMSNDLRTLSQAVADLTSSLQKMQGQLTDLSRDVKAMQAGPAPPPPGGQEQPAGASAAPTIPMRTLYENANGDRMSGKFDLAIQEYTDFLRMYGNTDLAPNAQYYIAWIHMSKGEYDTAVREYDAVLEKYPDNNKTPDAMFGKGQSLVKLGRRSDGAKEFRELITKYPKHDLAPRACDALKGLGLGCPTARATSPAKGAGKRKK